MNNELGGPVVTLRTTDFLFVAVLIAAAVALVFVAGMFA